MKYIIITLFITLILLTFSNKSTKMHTPLTHNTILAFGDSLTYGHGANDDESYPARLSSLSGLKVINAGISGETSSDGLQRLPELLEDESISLMILCFGGNDILREQSMDSLKNNLKTMIEMAKTKEIEVLLITVPNLNLFGLSPLDLYKEVAKEESVPFLSGLFTEILNNPALKSDQIHPNALGYKLMADKIYKNLVENGWIAN